MFLWPGLLRNPDPEPGQPILDEATNVVAFEGKPGPGPPLLSFIIRVNYSAALFVADEIA